MRKIFSDLAIGGLSVSGCYAMDYVNSSAALRGNPSGSTDIDDDVVTLCDGDSGLNSERAALPRVPTLNEIKKRISRLERSIAKIEAKNRSVVKSKQSDESEAKNKSLAMSDRK